MALAPEEAQACDLGRTGRDGFRLANVLKLKNQTSPNPARKGTIWLFVVEVGQCATGRNDICQSLSPEALGLCMHGWNLNSTHIL